MAHHLSKSRYTAGLQCPRRLWWTVHDPEAAELVPDPVLESRFAWGRRVGEAARRAAGEGVLIEREGRSLADALRATEEAVRGGARRIFEAAFVHREVFVAVDLLERGGGGWTVTEVKSSTGLEDQHLPDATVQAWTVEGAGLPVKRVELMHLNRACRYPHLEDLFVREDVTGPVDVFLPSVPGQVRAQLDTLAGPLPEVEIGPHCDAPYPCPFKARCWPDRGPHHLSTLYRGGARVRALLDEGCERIADLPAHVELTEIQARQCRAVRTGDLVVEPGLAAALDAFEEPLAYLDFETVALPIPVWNGCRPYDQVPVQFACFAPDATGSTKFAEHLATGPKDPRPALAAALVRALEHGGTILAYHVSFERLCVRHLAESVPDLERALLAIHDRLDDLLPVVRDHVYHPAFAGSFSMKAVLPALLPELAYDDLEVAGGLLASTELQRLLFASDAMAPEARRALRRDLLAYCKRDTEGLRALHDWLRTQS